jgi:hypothetical protein
MMCCHKLVNIEALVEKTHILGTCLGFRCSDQTFSLLGHGHFCHSRFMPKTSRLAHRSEAPPRSYITTYMAPITVKL